MSSTKSESQERRYGIQVKKGPTQDIDQQNSQDGGGRKSQDGGHAVGRCAKVTTEGEENKSRRDLIFILRAWGVDVCKEQCSSLLQSMLTG